MNKFQLGRSFLLGSDSDATDLSLYDMFRGFKYICSIMLQFDNSTQADIKIHYLYTIQI